jgi:hypothetical protein
MIPAGQHTIEWSFEPSSYTKAVNINWIGSIMILAIVVIVFALSLKSVFTVERSTEA